MSAERTHAGLMETVNIGFAEHPKRGMSEVAVCLLASAVTITETALNNDQAAIIALIITGATILIQYGDHYVEGRMKLKHDAS